MRFKTLQRVSLLSFASSSPRDSHPPLQKPKPRLCKLRIDAAVRVPASYIWYQVRERVEDSIFQMKVALCVYASDVDMQTDAIFQEIQFSNAHLLKTSEQHLISAD